MKPTQAMIDAAQTALREHENAYKANFDKNSKEYFDGCMSAAIEAAVAAMWQPLSLRQRDGSRMFLRRYSYELTIGQWVDLTQLNCWGRIPNDGITGRWLAGDPADFESDEALHNYLLNAEYAPTHWAPLLPSPNG